jgi:hypothetical protein
LLLFRGFFEELTENRRMMHCIMQERRSALYAYCMKTLIALGKGREWIFQYSGKNPHWEAEIQIYSRIEAIRTGVVAPWHDLCLYELEKRLRCSWKCGKTS